jgi:hypothetical protein
MNAAEPSPSRGSFSRGRIERYAGVFALWCIAMLVLMFARPSFTSASKPQHGIPDPVLALQMAHDISDVDAVLGEAPSADREVMRTKQYEDFGFIAGYACLYVAISLLLARIYSTNRRMRWIAGVAAIAGLAAAVLDCIENFAILRILDVKVAATTQPMIYAIHHAAMFKWACGFIALGLLSTYFLWDRRRTAKVVGAIDAAACLLGLIALYDNALLLSAAALIGLGLMGTSVVFLLLPLKQE